MMCCPIINASGPTGGGIPPVPPTASFIWEPQPVYQGSPFSLIDTSAGTDPKTYSWTVNGNFISSKKDPLYYPGNFGTIVVGLTVTNVAGSDSTSNTIKILPAA
jgi:PKD repeat protein